MRKIVSAVLALGLVASTAFAADNNSTSPLSPGKPAGVKQANLTDNGTFLTIGLMAAGVIAGVIASQNSTTGTFTGPVSAVSSASP